MAGVTLRDLAEKLGVSAATISMVLNNKPGISEETRTRVLKEVEVSGYDVDRLFGSSKKQRGSIGFIIYKKHGMVVSDTPFFSVLTESIEQHAAAAGHNLSIRYISDRPDIPDFGKLYPDGIILLGTEMDENDLRPFMDMSIPCVVLDNAFPLTEINTVSIDNCGGIYSAVKHLCEMGHREIGYMKSSIPIRNFLERYSGFTDCAELLDIEMGSVVPLSSTMEGAYQDMKLWLESNKPCAAYVADNDIIALGAVRALRERGYMLGRDVSVVGFDDLPFTRISEPPLTTVRVFNDALGAAVFKRLADISADDFPFTHTLVGTELKVRGSVLKLDK